MDRWVRGIPRFDAACAWRRLGRSRWLVGALLFVTVLASTVGVGTLLVHGFSNDASHGLVRASKPPRVDPKGAGAWFQLSHFGKTHAAPDARAKAIKQASKLPKSPMGNPSHGAKRNVSGSASLSISSLAAGPGQWSPVGPAPISTDGCDGYFCTSYGNAAGRVTALAINPSDSQDIWAGAADGGLWHSTDDGAHWAPITDDQPTLSIGAIALDTHSGSPYTIYAGTGEANNNGDAYWGDGILKSSDGGATWTLLGSSYFGGLGFTRLAVDPNNSSNILAATALDSFTTPTGGAGSNLYKNLGIWRSTDGGSTWTEVLTNSNNSASSFLSGSDIVFDPGSGVQHNEVVYAALANPLSAAPPSSGAPAGVYQSRDGGATWSGGGPTGAWNVVGAISRVGLGITADGNHIYAVAACDGSKPACGKYGELVSDSIFIGDTSGGWTAKPVPTEMAQDHSEYQWFYESSVGVDPADSTGNTVYVGGVDLWKTTDGGTTWTNLSNAYGSPPTANSGWDNHAIAFVAGGGTFFTGSDAGIMRGTVSGGSVTFTNRNSGLNITQFYSGGTSTGTASSDGTSNPGTYSQLWGGAQDNGLSAYPDGAVSLASPAVWNQQIKGDFTSTVQDWYDNAYVFTNLPYGQGIFSITGDKSYTNGGNWYCLYGYDPSTGCTTLDNHPTNWVAPLVESAGNHSELLAGTNQVYRSLNADSGFAPTWTPISPTFCGSASCGAPLSALAVAPANDNYVYAGDNSGQIFATSNARAATPTWHGGAVSGSTGGIVTGLAVDPINSSVAYATMAGFSNTTGQHVFKTTNAGGNWFDISATLPNVPFASVLVNPNNPRLVIAGSDTGIFSSPDAGTTWQQLGTGLPNVAVDQIFTNHPGTALFVATHGRGMWALTFPHLTVSPEAIATSTTPGVSPPSQTLVLQNTGFGDLNWSVSGLPSWVAVSPSSGTLPPSTKQTVTVSFAIPGTDGPQTYTTSLQFSDPNADNSPLSVPVTVVAHQVATTWNFAEGYSYGPNGTDGAFRTLFTLENPGTSPVRVTLTYHLTTSSTPLTQTLTIPAQSRATADPKRDVGLNNAFSTTITASAPIVAERPLYFWYTRNGQIVEGGFDTLGATDLGSRFAFAQFLVTSARQSRSLFTVLNPTPAPLYATVTFYPQAGGAAIPYQQLVPANARGTIDSWALASSLNAQGPLPPGLYSAQVALSSDAAGGTPVDGLVERPLYTYATSSGYRQSTCVIGVPAAGTAWYFAEGYTGSSSRSGQFTETLLLANPGASDAHVSVQLAPPSPSSPGASTSRTLAPHTLQTVDVNALLPNSANSASVTADQPILAERLLTFTTGATDVLGAPRPSHEALFAEGYTGGGFRDLVTLQNPNPTQAAYITVRALPASAGASPVTTTLVLPPRTRATLDFASLMPNQAFSTQLLANVPIVAERPMYFDFGGTDALGYQPPGS